MIRPPDKPFKQQLSISETRNALITRSLLMRNYAGVVKTSVYEIMERKVLWRLSTISVLSTLKNGAKFWKGDNYFFVFNLWSRGYYHWMTEVALKIVLFEEEIKKGVLIVPYNTPAFISDFISLAGIKNVRVMTGNCFVKRVKVIDNPVPGYPNPAHISQLRSFILDRIKDTGAKAEKIYISRRKAQKRKVLNEEQVKNCLEQQGFLYVELESMPWYEQVNLFRHCRLLVSIHGAGLTNTIFMPANSCVIELYPDTGTDYNPCYPVLCEALGLQHRFLFSKREYPDTKPDFHSDNIEVNISQLEQMLKE